MKPKSFPLLPLLLVIPLLAACSQADDPTDGTPTPTPTATPLGNGKIGSESHNLAFHAVVTASSPSISDASWGPLNVKDYVLGNKDLTEGVVWRPANINSSWVKLTWNSQVRVSQIHLHDTPALGHRVTSGRILFENTKDSDLSFAPVNFSDLPDDGVAFGTVTAPSDPITSMTVFVLGHTGDQAGLAEIVVMGTRVEEKIERNGDIAAHGRVTGFSTVLSPFPAYGDSGPYRTARLQDGLTSTAWRSAGNGSGAFVELTFDRRYAFYSIELFDLDPANATLCHFTKARVRFRDLTKVFDFPEKLATASSVILDLSDEEIASYEIGLEFLTDGVVAGSSGNTDCGFSEVKIDGSYDL